MTRGRLILVLVVLLLIVLPLSTVAYVALTANGLQLVVSHIPKRIGRAQINITTPRGTLAGGFEVDRIEIDHERCHVIVEGLRAKVSLLALLWRTVDAHDATVKHAFVQVRRRTQPINNNAPLHFVPVGLVVRIDGARIASATLIATNGRRFDTSGGQVSGTVKPASIRLFDTTFDWEAMHVDGNAKLTAASPMKLSGDARITFTWPQQPVWTLDATAKGDLDALGLQAIFTTPFSASFRGQARDLTSQWNWSGDAQVHDFDLRAWGGGGALGRITGMLKVHGNSDGFGGTGPLTPAGLAAGAFDSTFEGSYADRVVTADRIEIKHPLGTILRGAGSITVVDNGPRLDLRGTWQGFRWPLVGKDIGVRSAGGNYELSGVWPYDWRASGPLLVTGFEPMPTEGRGRLAKDRAYLDQVAVEAFGGRATLSGETVWTPGNRWRMAGHMVGMNPGTLRADIPGKLDFNFDAQGESFDSQGDFSFAMRDIAGKLRGVAASGSGSIARRGKTWELGDIRLGLGRTRIEANGHIADEVDVGFAVAAEDLSWLEKDSRGHLNARGRLQGTAEDPTVVASVHGTGLSYAGIQLARLDADIDFDSRSARKSAVSLQARNLAYRKRTIDALDFTLLGPVSSHVAHLDVTAPNLALQLRAAGAFAHGGWSGQLTELGVTGSESLNLALESPAGLVISQQQMHADKFCLQGSPGRICADGNWTPAKWTAALNASELPLRTLTAGLTPEVDYRGSLTITAHASGAQGEEPQGNLRADLLDARMVHRLASGKRQSILLGSGLVTVDATANAIDAHMGLDAGPIGTIAGKVTLVRGTPRWQDMPLQGSLKIHTAELGFVTLYAPQVDRAAGQLEAQMALSGTAGTPLVDGSLRLTDAELDQYQVNMAMRNVNLSARLHGNGLDFDGTARVGEGGMSTNGKLEWRDALPYGKLHLEGDRLRVANVPEAHIDASPNLDFAVDARTITVTGKVSVPYAKIEPTDLRNAVRSSADEIIVGAEAQDPAKRFHVISDIELALSDGVSINTSGLTGHLTGSIRVRSGQDDLTRGTGELSVAEGKYSAYGRKLDIERGRLIFTGGPVGNPGVDIRAVKQFPDMKAGVNVRGTLLQPRLTFFSEPSLPQSQILSLILAGGSLSASTTTTSTSTRQPGGGGELLAQGGAILAQQLGEKVGIEDVSVEQDLSNETSLVLGKYLSPRLYVSYGISLAESINTLKMRYSLNDHWTIRSEVGEARGADLVYTIEK